MSDRCTQITKGAEAMFCLKHYKISIRANIEWHVQNKGRRLTCSAGSIPNRHVMSTMLKIRIDGSFMTAHNCEYASFNDIFSFNSGTCSPFSPSQWQNVRWHQLQQAKFYQTLQQSWDRSSIQSNNGGLESWYHVVPLFSGFLGLYGSLPTAIPSVWLHCRYSNCAKHLAR